MPFGSSYVSFMLFYSTLIGKIGLGAVVSHKRKLLSTFHSVKPSKTFSRVPIKLAAKWQFYKNTHFPSAHALVIAFKAPSP
jgi:hypothetical protein